MSGLFRVVVGLAATAATLLVYGVVLPAAIMVVVLYLVKMLPISGRGKRL